MGRASASDPPTRIANVTPNDSADLPFRAFAVSFATAGAIEVVTTDGDTVVIPSGALAAGIQHSMSIRRVKAANTTALSIVAYG